jgi:hypothetical protein
VSVFFGAGGSGFGFAAVAGAAGFGGLGAMTPAAFASVYAALTLSLSLPRNSAAPAALPAPARPSMTWTTAAPRISLAVAGRGGRHQGAGAVVF